MTGLPSAGPSRPTASCWQRAPIGATVHLWEVAAGERVGELVTDDKKLYAVDFSPDRPRLAVSGGGGTVSVWDAQTWKKSWVSSPQSLPVMVVVFSPDGKTLATTSYDWQRCRSRAK